MKNIADSLKIPFFIVGATARDFLLKHCYGVDPPRMTRDIDLAVKVADWKQFGKLTEALKDTRKFTADRREQQRFRYDNVLIDIVPFGPISDRNGKISWPPEHEIFMKMTGFQEAYQCSVTVRLHSDPELDVKIPTLPGLALRSC
ncbi:MAG: nucleotidyl transferase AbiEii/AbiGii toxin family protein [Deltaproteobacteria bacterium]|nr:nucleotidyl transferase AbiEii/AbiGii toxin family protein [Deltaproteobacteria bacterium]